MKDASICLPRNIRQIGNPSSQKKIYIEDYVVTYLNKLAQPNNVYSRGAILLGFYQRNQSGNAIFISGAIEAQNLEFDLDETVFTNETWTKIYAEIKTYFPELEVVGWFLSRLGFSTEVNDKILKTHLENFSGKDKILYMIDSLECEDTFYIYEGNSLRRQGGYYIYYERNENMQNYMIENKPEMEKEQPEVEEDIIKKRDEMLIRNYRTTLKNKRSKKRGERILYGVSTCLTVSVLAFGITLVNNYDKIKSMEDTINGIKVSMVGGDNVIPVTNTSVSNSNLTKVKNLEDVEENEKITEIEISTKEDENKMKTEINKEEVTEIEIDTEESKDKMKTEINKEEVTEIKIDTEEDENKMKTEIDEEKEKIEKDSTVVKEKKTEENTIDKKKITESIDTNDVEYYIILKGDTLVSISNKMYNSPKYVDEILKANNIEDVNTIYQGQKIIIPKISK